MKSYILFLAIFLAKTVTNGDHVHERKTLKWESIAHSHREICFPGIGCFNCKKFGIFHWPLTKCYDPMSPTKIDTRLSLLTRKERNGRWLPSIYPNLPTTNLTDYGYRPHKKTVFIIHGFLGSSEVHWAHQIAQAYLDREDVNVLLVDWRKGAAGGHIILWNKYGTAAANTQIVGAVLARFVVDLLVKKYGQDIKKIHVIGFSLGGQVAGFFGKKVKTNKSFSKKTRGRRLGKITGVDPAGPGFERYKPNVHLTADDADYVEVMHTNGLGGYKNASDHLKTQNRVHSIDRATVQIVFPNFFGLGTVEPLGTVDYYMNGGGHQPGCKLNGLKGIPQGHTELEIGEMTAPEMESWVACSHSRAPIYYATLLKYDPKDCFIGHRLTEDQQKEMFKYLKLLNYKVFHVTALPKCEKEKNNCLAFTLETDQHEPVKGVLYTPIASHKPWCLSNQNSAPPMYDVFED